jgi:hypothetical protein
MMLFARQATNPPGLVTIKLFYLIRMRRRDLADRPVVVCER